MIQFYTREAGVRTLERTIGTVCRKAARELLKNKDKKIRITGTNLGKYLESINYMDYAFGILIEKLKEARLYEDSIIIVFGVIPYIAGLLIIVFSTVTTTFLEPTSPAM